MNMEVENKYIVFGSTRTSTRTTVPPIATLMRLFAHKILRATFCNAVLLPMIYYDDCVGIGKTRAEMVSVASRVVG